MCKVLLVICVFKCRKIHCMVYLQFNSIIAVGNYMYVLTINHWILYFAGVFYYVLGNIRPIFHSTTRNIQLLGIAKTADLKKYGCDKFLELFTQEINLLSKVCNVFLRFFPNIASKLFQLKGL